MQKRSRFQTRLGLILCGGLLLFAAADATAGRETAQRAQVISQPLGNDRAEIWAQIEQLRALRAGVGREARRARIIAKIHPWNLLARDLNARFSAAYRDVYGQMIGRLEGLLNADQVWKHQVQLGEGRTTTVYSKSECPRIGFFPTAGYPVHHGHLLTSLRAIGLDKVDAVVYRLQGADKKLPQVAATLNFRRDLTQKALASLPGLALFENKSTADLRGNQDVASFLSMPDQPRMRVKYIAGADEYNSYGTLESPSVLGDLSQRLELARQHGHELSALLSLRTLGTKQYKPAEVPHGFAPVDTEVMRGVRFGLDRFLSSSAVRLAFDPTLAKREPRLAGKPAHKWNQLLVPAALHAPMVEEIARPSAQARP